MKQFALIVPTLLFAAVTLSACQKQAPENVSRADESIEIPGLESLTKGTGAAPATAATETAAANSAGKVYGTVSETFDSGGYTYLQVDTGDEKIWAAGPPTPLKKGDMVSFTTEMPMENFHSKTLNRDFAVLFFVRKVNTGGAMGAAHPEVAESVPHTTAKSDTSAQSVRKVEKLKDGYTIDEIYQQKTDLAGKRVRVRGEVTKVTLNVQNINWVHIEDGSHTQDLTVTTTDDAKLGSVVVVEGKVSSEKDTGFGHVYAVMLEDGKLDIEQ